MRGIDDPKLLWAIGAIMIVFCAVGMVASATLIALPLCGIAYAFGAAPDTLLKIAIYSAVLWAPLGVGGGVATSAVLIRGIRSKAPDEPKSRV